MKIYTSYFGNAKKLHEANVEMVNIARYKPRYFNGFSLLAVAPLPFMLKDDMTVEQYVEHYNRLVLKPLDIERFLQTLESLCGGKDIALCCYEKPGQFCHRHLLAEWLNEHGGLDIKEFGVNEKVVEEAPTLF